MATTERRLDSDVESTAPTDDAGEPLETMAAWCKHHDLIHGLLPFECRQTDTFAEFEALAEALRELPETAATFRLGDLQTPEGHREVMYRPTGAGVVETQLHLLGAWEFRETSSGWRWINPHYIHDHPWQSPQQDLETRVRTVRAAAQLGALRYEDVAPRFGITSSALNTWITSHGLPWGAWREAGRERLAKTLRTVHAWSGRDLWAMCQLFRVPAETVETWLNRLIDDAWTPPADPSRYHGFQKVGTDV